jgi:hypothetical protein
MRSRSLSGNARLDNRGQIGIVAVPHFQCGDMAVDFPGALPQVLLCQAFSLLKLPPSLNFRLNFREGPRVNQNKAIDWTCGGIADTTTQSVVLCVFVAKIYVRFLFLP